VKLADLHWAYHSPLREEESMGLLRWHNREQQSFEVLDAPWLKEYSTSTWRNL
jgi:hypothetical protein